VCATSPATPFISFLLAFWMAGFGLVPLYPFLICPVDIPLEYFLNYTSKAAPACVVFYVHNFSCSYSSRRGREKGLGLVFGFYFLFFSSLFIGFKICATLGLTSTIRRYFIHPQGRRKKRFIFLLLSIRFLFVCLLCIRE
jgi:hypothetical protein